MNQLIGRIRTRSRVKFYRILSGENVYEIDVDSLHLVDYQPDHNLDEEAWFQVQDFNSKTYFPAWLGQHFISAEYDGLPKAMFSRIAYLVSIQNGDFYFQKVTPSLLITRKLLAFGEYAKLENSSDRILIEPEPSAIYLKQSDSLLFKSLATISSIFIGIDELYREATDQEIEQFFSCPFVGVAGTFNIQSVSITNRKRIGLASKTLAEMGSEDQAQLPDYISEYCGERLPFDQGAGKFQISSDEDLKLLLYGIEQRFYTTPFGKEKRLANSVQRIIL